MNDVMCDVYSVYTTPEVETDRQGERERDGREQPYVVIKIATIVERRKMEKKGLIKTEKKLNKINFCRYNKLDLDFGLFIERKKIPIDLLDRYRKQNQKYHYDHCDFKWIFLNSVIENVAVVVVGLSQLK